MEDSCSTNASSKLHNNKEHWNILNLIKCAYFSNVCYSQQTLISSHIPYRLLKEFGDVVHGLGDFWKD